MNRQLLIGALLVITISGCKSKQAFKYSEKIVEIERSLTPDIIRTEESVTGFFKSMQYDSAAIVSRRMEDIVEGKINEIKTLDPPEVKEAENFKRAAVRYFSYMKSLYTSYREFAEQTNDDEREIKRQRLLKIVGEKEDAVAEMQRAQKKYAKANNFKIND